MSRRRRARGPPTDLAAASRRGNPAPDAQKSRRRRQTRRRRGKRGWKGERRGEEGRKRRGRAEPPSPRESKTSDPCKSPGTTVGLRNPTVRRRRIASKFCAGLGQSVVERRAKFEHARMHIAAARAKRRKRKSPGTASAHVTVGGDVESAQILYVAVGRRRRPPHKVQRRRSHRRRRKTKTSEAQKSWHTVGSRDPTRRRRPRLRFGSNSMSGWGTASPTVAPSINI